MIKKEVIQKISYADINLATGKCASPLRLTHLSGYICSLMRRWGNGNLPH